MTFDGNGAVSEGLATAFWRKASFSGVGECVTLAEQGHQVALRNSRHPDRGTLLFPRSQMAAWVAGCKDGSFDDLAV